MNNKNLKKAIAEAKTLRETALAQAKLALEEAFTPQLQSMLAAKLQEMEEDEPVDENDISLDEIDLDELLSEADDDEDSKDTKKSKSKPKEEEEEEEEEEEDEEEEDFDFEMDDDESEEDDDSKDISDMSPEEVEQYIRDIASEEFEKLEASQGEEGESYEGSEDDEDIDLDIDMGDESDEDAMGGSEDPDALDEYDDELYEAKRKTSSLKKKLDNTKEELKEAYNTIDKLRKNIKESNVINAKLIYLNRTFKDNSLSESQKLSVIKTFDKANSINDAKLIYESLRSTLSRNNKKTQLKENLGFASKPSGNFNTKVVNDDFDQSNRWMRLAGLK